MLYDFNSYFRIRTPHKFTAFLHFHTCVCGNSGQFNGQEVSYYFLENPLPCRTCCILFFLLINRILLVVEVNLLGKVKLMRLMMGMVDLGKWVPGIMGTSKGHERRFANNE